MAPFPDMRDSLPAPKHPDGRFSSSESDINSGDVHLRHPGYPDSQNILLVLSALDLDKKQALDDDGRIAFGLHHETARVACAILANCRWDGFLSEDKAADARPVMIGPDDILLGRNYYFHITNTNPDEPYPIVPSFAHFKFPHNNLPPSWKASSLILPEMPNTTSKTVLSRDVSCRITLSTLATEKAHLIPRREKIWFLKNAMYLYSSQRHVITANHIDDIHNSMLLCSNIHHTFDQRRFIFVPKNGSWVIHVIAGKPEDELAAVYHNAKPQQLSSIAVEYFFARFAWTVLNAGNFAAANCSRRLVTLRAEDGVPGVSDVPVKEYHNMIAPKSRSRNYSPKKRARNDTEGVDVLEDPDDVDDSSEFSDEFNPFIDLDELPDEDDPVWVTRGRSRKQARYG